MSLLLRPPAPAVTARRGAELAGPPEPKSPPESSEPKLPPPPPLRPSSIVSVELKPCSTTSVEYFSTPAWSVHLRVCSAPSRYTLAPFFRYCSAILQSPSLKITTRCHSVFSLRSPVPLSRQVSEVATLRLAIGRPSCVRRISGSLPRFPTRITLFTLPAIAALHSKSYWQILASPDTTAASAAWSALISTSDIRKRPIRCPKLPVQRSRRYPPVIHI